MTVSAHPEPSTRPPQPMTTERPRPDEELRRYVTDRVVDLQQRFLREESAARASLARLRRAVASRPGSAPEVWAETLLGLPAGLAGHGSDPSQHESAAHAALCLYALHQQSQPVAMHRDGQSLGAALRRLVTSGVGVGEDAVRRRFQALGTASSLPEALHHLRGLVTQLRGAAVPLDHGLLAHDLRRLQDPRHGGGVRLRWGRDFYRARPQTEPTAPTTPSTTGEQ